MNGVTSGGVRPILTAGGWGPSAGTETFRAFDLRSGQEIGPAFPVSPRGEVEAMAAAGREAAPALAALGPWPLAAFFEDYARRLDEDAAGIADLADAETALGTERFTASELPRVTDQLRQTAACVRDGAWRRPVIDAGADLRSVLEPLGGPVFVVGPNNFPLAYNGAAGGDFCAALAAGNSILAKAHPAHPGTSERLARHAAEAAGEAGLPAGTIQMLYRCDNEDGLRLIRERQVSAVGFTGTKGAGTAMLTAGAQSGTPVYVEMSSINPVVVLAGALRQRGGEIARELAESMLAAGGQQCTSPGFIVVPGGDATRVFIDALRGALEAAEPSPRLTRGVVEGFVETVDAWREHGAEVLLGGSAIERAGFYAQHTLASVGARRAVAEPGVFQREAFGTGALVVVCDRPGEARAVVGSLEGQLTGSIYSAEDGSDDAEYDAIAPALRVRVGRLLNDAVTTGVKVSPAMVHGGPFPATGHPGFTAVGVPAAIERFCARRCYDRVREGRLPGVLRASTKEPTNGGPLGGG